MKRQANARNEIRHDHPGEALTFGCAGCVERVRRDQRLAEIADAPLRELRVEWRATAEQYGTTVLEVNALGGEDAATVLDRNREELYDAIACVVEFLGDYEIDIDDTVLAEDDLGPRPARPNNQLALG